MVRILGLFTAAVVVAVPTAASLAQTPDRSDPNVLRSPAISSLTSDQAALGAITLAFEELLSAIARGDTVTVRALLPDTAIPQEEQNAASRLGCRSMTDVVARMRPDPKAFRDRAPDYSLRVAEIKALPQQVADGVVTAQFSIQVMMPLRRAEMLEAMATMLPDGHARRIDGLEGVLVGLCSVSDATRLPRSSDEK